MVDRRQDGLRSRAPTRQVSAMASCPSRKGPVGEQDRVDGRHRRARYSPHVVFDPLDLSQEVPYGSRGLCECDLWSNGVRHLLRHHSWHELMPPARGTIWLMTVGAFFVAVASLLSAVA